MVYCGSVHSLDSALQVDQNALGVSQKDSSKFRDLIAVCSGTVFALSSGYVGESNG